MKTIIFDLDGTLIDLKTGECFLCPEDLQALTDTFQFALVTGASFDEVESALATLEMTRFFPRERVVCKEDTVGGKDTGKPFLKAVQEVGDNAIVIGDSWKDEKGSLVAGLKCLKVSQDLSTKDAVEFALALFRGDVPW